MRKKAPLVRDCMTHLPVEAESCQTVADAKNLMTAGNIRHLPVMNGARLHGLISERDLLTARLRHGKALDNKPLEEICQSDILTVSPVADISEVARKMLDRQVDCAVVVDGGFVVGMFTTTDALRLLQSLFTRG